MRRAEGEWCEEGCGEGGDGVRVREVMKEGGVRG